MAEAVGVRQEGVREIGTPLGSLSAKLVKTKAAQQKVKEAIITEVKTVLQQIARWK